jgi:DNA-binding MarR family transcriptional regulator
MESVRDSTATIRNLSSPSEKRIVTAEWHDDAVPGIGALLRFPLYDLRARIYAGVAEAGFDDIRPAHVTLFRWPGPDGRRPTEVAADAQISKQRVNDLLRELERAGYLQLRPDPTDQRARIIELTERGWRLQKTAIHHHHTVEDGWAAAVGAERWAQLRATLAEISAGRERRVDRG